MINVLHENNEWIEPFVKAFRDRGIDYELWYMPEREVDFGSKPLPGVYYNRMSASSHTRGHRFEPELTVGVLEWLERHNRLVVNGSRALDLEISKIRQYQELEKYGIRTPKTFAAINTKSLLRFANQFDRSFVTKHNRSGKGIGVYKFDHPEDLCSFFDTPDFESSPDGINLVQQYIEPCTPHIYRMEFVESKFLYAVKVDTSKGFDLCPADGCEVKTDESDPKSSKFEIVDDFHLDNLDSYESFLSENGIGIAGIEIIFDTTGRHWTYDVNTNTNYNAHAESQAGVSACDEIAKFLFRLINQPSRKFGN